MMDLVGYWTEYRVLKYKHSKLILNFT